MRRVFHLGYGFKQPKPGRWVVTLLTNESTPAAGADYAIMAVFDGGATLTARTDLTVPALNETVTVSADEMQSARATLRNPDGSVEVIDMSISGNTAASEVTPSASGMYGIEVSVTALAPDGMLVDRAAFLSFETQPVDEQIMLTRYLVVGGVILLILAIVGIFLA